jgi:hypothetical protein
MAIEYVGVFQLRKKYEEDTFGIPKALVLIASADNKGGGDDDWNKVICEHIVCVR